MNRMENLSEAIHHAENNLTNKNVRKSSFYYCFYDIIILCPKMR
jgi:hypothetical protein